MCSFISMFSVYHDLRSSSAFDQIPRVQYLPRSMAQSLQPMGNLSQWMLISLRLTFHLAPQMFPLVRGGTNRELPVFHLVQPTFRHRRPTLAYHPYRAVWHNNSVTAHDRQLLTSCLPLADLLVRMARNLPESGRMRSEVRAESLRQCLPRRLQARHSLPRNCARQPSRPGHQTKSRRSLFGPRPM